MTRDLASEVVTSLFEESYHSFTRLACRGTGNLHRAEELVQDVLTALFAELRRGKTIQSPKAWCLVVLQRKVNRERRRNQAASILQVDDFDAFAASAPTPPSAEPENIPELLAHLTEREQEVMLLRMESLKYREIADVLGISKNTVNALLARGLGKLHALVRKPRPESSAPERRMEKRKSAAALQCPILVAHADGELPFWKRRSVRIHLENCWRCRARMSDLEARAEAVARPVGCGAPRTRNPVGGRRERSAAPPPGSSGRGPCGGGCDRVGLRFPEP
jgi:RNA polymerase sigma-70 factor (ECF subfamily)